MEPLAINVLFYLTVWIRLTIGLFKTKLWHTLFLLCLCSVQKA